MGTVNSNRILRVCAAAALVLLLAAPTEAGQTSAPFYIIAHMTNSPHSLDWAIREGANAIEADIRFDDSGQPAEFEHGGLCDCSCIHPRSYHICSQSLVGCSGSGAKARAVDHLRHMARLSGLALVFLDGKVKPWWGDRLATAGTNLVNMVERELFGHGYRGNVIISASKINRYEYVYAAARAVSGLKNKNHYFFTFDQEGNDYHSVVATLSRFTKKRAFGTGITACLPGSYSSGIRQAVSGVQSGQMGLTYIWTLDRKYSFLSYINLGVHGIITNRPGLLKNLAIRLGLRLARPGDIIPTALVDVKPPNRCDCDYQWGGGCTISAPAPPFKACRCKYTFLWTCGGSVVDCDWNDSKCINPDASEASCLVGGGECGGY